MSDRRRLRVRCAALAVAALLLCSAAASPVAAASGQVQLDAALENQSESDELSFTFTASRNGTHSATGSLTRDGGNVRFEFRGWENVDTGEDGGSAEWEATAGDTYRVTYEATAISGTSAGTYRATAEVDGPGGQVASERLSLSVDVAYPEFGRIGTQSTEVVFTEESSASRTLDVEFDNTGRGTMKPTDVTFSSVPSGMSVEAESLPDTVAASGSGTFEIDVTVDDSVSAGTHSFGVRIDDNLDSTAAGTFTVDVAVRKPPVLSVDGGDVDVGDVLVGRSTSQTFTVSESANNQGIDGVTAEVIGSESDARLDVRGGGSVNTGPGGSDTMELEVTVGDDASQHAELEWPVKLTPDNQNSPSTSVDVRARVIYPANLGAVSAPSAELVYDTPKSEVDAHTTRTTVEFENTGDLEMEVSDVAAQVQGTGVRAEVVDEPSTVGGLSNGSATIEFAGDPAASEGTYPVTIAVRTADAGTRRIEREVTVRQEPRLGVERTELSYGDVIVTKRRTVSTDLSEVLEYERVENLSVEKVSGPEGYIQIVDRPSSIEPGQTTSLVFAVTFDTSAELFRQYNWTYEVRGEGVESRRVSVTARAKPFSFEQIKQNLSAHSGSGGPQADISSDMIGAFDTLEGKLRGDANVPSADLTRTVAAGETSLLLLDSIENATRAREQSGPQAAQTAVIRAAATRNAMATYVNQIEDPAVRRQTQSALSKANETVDAQLELQASYYRERLNDTTTLDRAQAARRLAAIQALRGDEARSEELRARSDAAFDRYLAQVENATADRRRARESYAAFRDNATAVLAGRPVVLNPARLDAIDARIDRIRGSYADSTRTFAAAGAAQEEARVRSERSRIDARLQTARYTLYGATGVYALLALVMIVRSSRNLYAYVRDTRTVALGDVVG